VNQSFIGRGRVSGIAFPLLSSLSRTQHRLQSSTRYGTNEKTIPLPLRRPRDDAKDFLLKRTRQQDAASTDQLLVPSPARNGGSVERPVWALPKNSKL
jgi:hypothetical protein